YLASEFGEILNEHTIYSMEAYLTGGLYLLLFVLSQLSRKSFFSMGTMLKLFVGLFFVYQIFYNDIAFWKCFWMVMPIVLIMSIPSLIFTIKEYVKETELYRRLFIHSKGGETA